MLRFLYQISSIYIFIATSILLHGCKAENDFDQIATQKWEPTLAISLINSTLQIEDILDKEGGNDFIETDSNKLITLIYQSKVKSIQGNDLYKIDDMFISINDTINPISYHLPVESKIEFLKLKEGTLEYSLEPDIHEGLDVSIKIPNLINEDTIFQHDFINIPSTDSSDKPHTFDLSGYCFDLNNDGGDTNVFVVEYVVIDKITGQNVTKDHPLDFTLSNLKFDYAEGYLGKISFNLSDTLTLSIFKNKKDGTIRIENPQIAISIINSFGIPITADFTSIEAQEDSLSSTVIDNPFLIDYPEIKSPSETRNTDVILNKSNSNLSNFIGVGPKNLFYSFNFSTNLNTDKDSVINFIGDSSRVDVDVSLHLPMHGIIDNLVIEDTFLMNLQLGNNHKEIENLQFKLQIENMLPLEVVTQVYFADSNLVILDSLLDIKEQILSPANINNDGKVIEPSTKTTFINFYRSRINHIEKAKYILLNGVFNTSDNENTSIKFFSDYFLGIKLGVITNSI